MYDALISAIRNYFLTQQNAPIELTDKYANIYNYDEADTSWLQDIDVGDQDESNYDTDDDDDDEDDLSQELADIIEGKYFKITLNKFKNLFRLN